MNNGRYVKSVKSNPQNGNEVALTSEILIMPDGRVLAHNLTPVFTAILSELNPDDSQFSPRRKQTKNNDYAC